MKPTDHTKLLFTRRSTAVSAGRWLLLGLLVAACGETGPAADAAPSANTESPLPESPLPESSAAGSPLSDGIVTVDDAAPPVVTTWTPGASANGDPAAVLPEARVLGANPDGDPELIEADGSTDDPGLVTAIDDPRADDTDPELDPAARVPDEQQTETGAQEGGVTVEVTVELDADTAWSDDGAFGGSVFVTQDGAAAEAVSVSVSVLAASGDEVQLSCETGASGRCSFDGHLPVAAFESGGTAQVVATAGGEQGVAALEVIATPSPLVIDPSGMGLQLPTSPRVAGEVFDTPVYIETTGSVPSAWDLAVDFDPAQLQVVAVSAGTCSDFAAPVHNGDVHANDTGHLLMNAINPQGKANCAADVRVHVATVTWQVRPDADDSSVTCTVRDLFNTSYTQLAHDKACDVADWAGSSTTGEVLVD